MKIVTTYDFTKEDLENIKTQLPENPCNNCPANYDGSCCGCSAGASYYEFIEPFKEAKILEYVLKYNQILKIHENMKDLIDREKVLKKQLESIGINFNEKEE